MKARFILTASLLLNLILFGVVLWLHRGASEPAIAAQSLTTSQETPPVIQQASPQPFHWSQLESSNYPTYIANLRGIGCPELTVREIITADVADLFAPRREPLLTKLAGVSAPAERSQAERALRQLDQEETSVVRRLFGIADPAAPDAPAPDQATASPSPLRNRRPAIEDTNAIMPLVFQSVDSKTVTLTADELQTIDEVRELFKAELGTNQDVNSPEYLRSWQNAQKQADNLLDARLGRQAVLKYAVGVQNQAAAGAEAGPGN
jgi:hypothetical protein